MYSNAYVARSVMDEVTPPSRRALRSFLAVIVAFVVVVYYGALGLPRAQQQRSHCGSSSPPFASLLYRLFWSVGIMKVVLNLFATVAIVHAFQPVARPMTPAAPFSTSLRMADGSYDFDVAIIGCGVGGHGAALHSRAQNLKTAVFSGEDVGMRPLQGFAGRQRTGPGHEERRAPQVVGH
jgi:hypothetical protein